MNAFPGTQNTLGEFPVENYHNSPKKIDAHDPLYVRTEKTHFPSDEKLKVPPIVFLAFRKAIPDVTIRLSFLPENWRKKVGDGDVLVLLNTEN